MPPLYVLNPPTNPFWDFVAGLEDHPFFAGPPEHAQPFGSSASEAPRESAWASKGREETTEPGMSERAQGKQTTAEDPHEVDPATFVPENIRSADAKDRFRRRGRWAREPEEGEESDRRCRGGPGRGPRGPRGHFGWGGPPPFNPFFGQQPWYDQQRGPGHPHGPDHPHGPGHPQGPDHSHGPDHPHGPGHPRGPGQHHGPPPHDLPHHGPPHDGPPGRHGRHGRHGPPPHGRGPHRRGSPHHPRPGFDLNELLNKLGTKLGVDLAGAAEGLGLSTDRFSATKTGQDIDFEPRCDIFENKNQYTIHLSLPGAKKSDVGVDYDGEHSVLRVTGVVHRPDADEQMLNELVVDGRKREAGVFEKAIRLGTKHDPASIDVAGINAKMTDGILIVKVPKIEKSIEKREVPITTDPIDAGEADYDDEYSEKPVLFDAEENASAAGTEVGDVRSKGPISLLDQDHPEEMPANVQTDTKKVSKKEEAEKEANANASKASGSEQLPAYSAGAQRGEEDWENFSDASGEAEYVKIDVK